MAVSKRGGSRSSTLVLAFWGVVMLFLGLGVGLLLSNQGCDRRKAKSVEKQDPAASSKKSKQHPQKIAVPEEGGKSETPSKAKPVPEAEVKPGSKPGLKPDAKAELQAESKIVLPRMAIVIDDFGYAPPELVQRLCAQPIAFSAAVLPYLEYTQASARIAHEAGKEILLHLPMEPLGYPGPGKNPGVDAVMFDLSESEIRARVRKALLDVPWRKGVNNHMGSRVTPDKKRMTWVLQEIKHAGCFFVDSRTEKDSVACDVAQSLNIPSIQRKVFLDDDKAFEAIAKQWERALTMAKKDGQVLVIGHIYPETVAALERLIPQTRGQIKFVKASELAR